MRNREVLKIRTDRAHAQAEGLWTGATGFDSLASYRKWLGMMLHLHEHFGLPAARVLGPSFVPVETARINALRHDLALPSYATQANKTPNESWAWGASYVLNGSAIGASILLKKDQMQATWPQAYLREMRTFATSGELSAFFAALDLVSLDLSCACEGASAVFDESIAHAYAT